VQLQLTSFFYLWSGVTEILLYFGDPRLFFNLRHTILSLHTSVYQFYHLQGPSKSTCVSALFFFENSQKQPDAKVLTKIVGKSRYYDLEKNASRKNLQNSNYNYS